MADRERESCNSRHFSRLMKSCFPNPTDHHSSSSPSVILSITLSKHHNINGVNNYKFTPSINSLPDDLLLDILSRAPHSSLPSLFHVCRRWSHLISSLSFAALRRRHHLLHSTLFSFSLFSATFSTLRLDLDDSWKLTNDAVFDLILPQARLASLGRNIYFIGRSSSALFDPWTGSVRARSGTLFPRKRFAVASVSGKIYVAGGSAKTSAVEEYDPELDEWRVVSHAQRRRYGCFGVGLNGVFYIVGGLKLGASDSRAVAGAEARVYASSMDMYDVGSGVWLRSRGVPGGGCVVGACGAHGHVYVLASHAVELSFWKFDNGKKKNGDEWCRMRSPPVPGQVTVDGTVRFSCVGVEDKVVLIQVMGCIDDVLRRSGRNMNMRGWCKKGLVLIFDCVTQEWLRAPDLPQSLQRPACVCVEC